MFQGQAECLCLWMQLQLFTFLTTTGVNFHITRAVTLKHRKNVWLSIHCHECLYVLTAKLPIFTKTSTIIDFMWVLNPNICKQSPLLMYSALHQVSNSFAKFGWQTTEIHLPGHFFTCPSNLADKHWLITWFHTVKHSKKWSLGHLMHKTTILYYLWSWNFF